MMVTDVRAMPLLAQETDGQPEHTSLYLPSALGKKLATTEHSAHVTELEKTLRRAKCLEELHCMQMACLQKSQMLIGKNKNACGEVANTRAQAMLSHLTKWISNATAKYTVSYQALKNLSIKQAELQPFQHLSIQVEWFHGREHYQQWQEEELWLWQEITSTLFTFKSMADFWHE
ncbi:hypothetical protein FRC11_002711 [Ceratobasidium sp. 423]|nr:hypothetical protein FRC11_002711 [Ceratobasidium sp. 423]